MACFPRRTRKRTNRAFLLPFLCTVPLVCVCACVCAPVCVCVPPSLYLSLVAVAVFVFGQTRESPRGVFISLSLCPHTHNISVTDA